MDSRACRPGCKAVKLALSNIGLNALDTEQSLCQEIAALRHELRRVSDALERGRSQDLERRARLLRENIALCEHELEQHRAALQSDENRD